MHQTRASEQGRGRPTRNAYADPDEPSTAKDVTSGAGQQSLGGCESSYEYFEITLTLHTLLPFPVNRHVSRKFGSFEVHKSHQFVSTFPKSLTKSTTSPYNETLVHGNRTLIHDEYNRAFNPTTRLMNSSDRWRMAH